MKIFISKQLNKYLAEGFPRLDKDYGKHVLPEPDAMRDFKKQSGWIGRDGGGYPMFPHISKEEYEHNAYELRDDDSITALIHYDTKKAVGRKARASKHRILDLPPTRFDDKFAEIVFYSITDNEVIAYYLVTYPTRLEQLMSDTVYDIEGNVVDDHDELRNILKEDEYTSNQIRNFVTKSQVGEERQVESFSQITQLTDRMSSVIGYIKTDPKTGEQMLTDRFGSVKGWYKPKYDMTFDRYSRVVGRGNLLSTLLGNKKITESKCPFAFLESPEFTAKWHGLKLTDDMLRAIQNDLLENPMRGDKIQDVPDALKTRFALKYSGKSYGGRVVYVEYIKKDKIYLIDVYVKQKQKDLTAQEKKILNQIIKRIKTED